MAASLSRVCQRLAGLSIADSRRCLSTFRIPNLLSIRRPSAQPFVQQHHPAKAFLSDVVGTPSRLNPTQPTVIHTEDGRQFLALDMRINPKLKPNIVRRRLAKMKTYVGTEKNIRHSPWRLNLVCQLAAGLPLQEAINQLQFCKKSKAPLVQKVLRRTSNLADIRDGLQISQLEVAECFATKGRHLKRIKPMARGRFGRMEHKFSHMRVVLREIDFKLRIYQAPTVGQKKKWFIMQQIAERDGARAKAERDEIKRLEREAEVKAKKTNS